MENDKSEEIDNDDDLFFDYNPFDSNDIMHITSTEKNYFILLRNGRVLSWGDNNFSLGRKCKNSGNESTIPKEIEFKVRILDIVCGLEHVLVRNVNHEVYSWGKNDYGQLGLIGVKNKEFDEKDEPCQIQYFQGIKIKQIFAKNHNSFAITDEANNIYGWGSNSNRLISKTINTDYIGLPTLIQIDFILMNELYFFIDSKAGFAEVIE